ncbi:MAG: hypothetical protein L0387_09300 [Acidobacteria bacterium]|nr:hypothetical protein [Acidobacteriota bacterium]MCI0621852.1 hypothetical protein [Acidobacteriota bacterium]MCI0724043.1 hypothetical protein [Acidobacteriota bacterium]
MNRSNWLRFGRRSKIGLKEISRKRSLANRIVLCADCDTNRALAASSSGNLICSSCGSGNWMFVAAPIIANFKEYNEQKIQERIAVDRYIAGLEREEFLTRQGALVREWLPEID